MVLTLWIDSRLKEIEPDVFHFALADAFERDDFDLVVFTHFDPRRDVQIKPLADHVMMTTREMPVRDHADDRPARVDREHDVLALRGVFDLYRAPHRKRFPRAGQFYLVVVTQHVPAGFPFAGEIHRAVRIGTIVD